MPRRLFAFLAMACMAFMALAGHSALAKGSSSAAQLLRAVDERQQNVGDWRSVVYLEQRENDRDLLVYEAVSMRRGADHKFAMVFTKPKTVAGQGYLRVDQNLWFYDPSVGRWERRTEREHVGGTISRRSDFDQWHLVDEYDSEDGAAQMVGQRSTRRLILKAKPGIDVAFPVIHLWVDEGAKIVLKRQEFALSGRLLRTTYYPKWERVYSPAKKTDVWYPKEIRLYDELETGKSTLLLIRDVDARPLAENIFTKAWLEHQSR